MRSEGASRADRSTGGRRRVSHCERPGGLPGVRSGGQRVEPPCRILGWVRRRRAIAAAVPSMRPAARVRCDLRQDGVGVRDLTAWAAVQMSHESRRAASPERKEEGRPRATLFGDHVVRLSRASRLSGGWQTQPDRLFHTAIPRHCASRPVYSGPFPLAVVIPASGCFGSEAEPWPTSWP